jgi:hypothetical protein
MKRPFAPRHGLSALFFVASLLSVSAAANAAAQCWVAELSHPIRSDLRRSFTGYPDRDSILRAAEQEAVAMAQSLCSAPLTGLQTYCPAGSVISIPASGGYARRGFGSAQGIRKTCHRAKYDPVA